MSYERLSPVSDTKEEVMQGEEKLTALQLEYTHLLSSQLESQRQFFENKIAEAQASALQEVRLIDIYIKYGSCTLLFLHTCPSLQFFEIYFHCEQIKIFSLISQIALLHLHRPFSSLSLCQFLLSDSL